MVPSESHTLASAGSSPAPATNHLSTATFMRQIAPLAFAYAEAERRDHRRQMANAYRRRQEREIEEWKQQQHTVMEIVGDDPTGLIVEMSGADIFRKNSEMLVIYLAEMDNWNSYGDDPKPRLRKFITPREFRIRKFNERKASSKSRPHSHV